MLSTEMGPNWVPRFGSQEATMSLGGTMRAARVVLSALFYVQPPLPGSPFFPTPGARPPIRGPRASAAPWAEPAVPPVFHWPAVQTFTVGPSHCTAVVCLASRSVYSWSAGIIFLPPGLKTATAQGRPLLSKGNCLKIRDTRTVSQDERGEMTRCANGHVQLLPMTNSLLHKGLVLSRPESPWLL